MSDYLIEGPLNLSFYHFVCDANVRENGSSVMQTVAWMKKILDGEQNNENNATLKQEVIEMQTQSDRLLALVNI